MKEPLRMHLFRKKLVSSFPPGMPIQSVFFDEEKNSYYRVAVVAINAFEIKFYNTLEEYDANCPYDVGVEYSMVTEDSRGEIDDPVGYENFICFEFNHEKNSRKQLDLMNKKKRKK